MNWNKVCEVGLKIAVTAITGLVAYFGISKAIKSNNTAQKITREPGVESNQQNPQSHGPQPQSNNIVSGLRGAQNTFTRLGSVVSNIATLAENISSLFGKDNCEQPYYNESWRNPNGFRRVSDFIMVVGDGTGTDNCYL